MNEEKIVTLGNLTAFKGLVEKEIPDNLLRIVSITGDMWRPISPMVEGYGYSAAILLDGVTSDSHGRIDFDIHSIQTCVEAGIAPSGETVDGKIILYAKKVPSNAVSGVCTIYWKG